MIILVFQAIVSTSPTDESDIIQSRRGSSSLDIYSTERNVTINQNAHYISYRINGDELTFANSIAVK